MEKKGSSTFIMDNGHYPWTDFNIRLLTRLFFFFFFLILCVVGDQYYLDLYRYSLEVGGGERGFDFIGSTLVTLCCFCFSSEIFLLKDPTGD